MMYLRPIRNKYWPDDGPKYWLQAQTYYSPRYDRVISIKGGTPSDGATGPFVPDIESSSWQIHDEICRRKPPRWDAKRGQAVGDLILPHQAAMVLSDILHDEGHHIRDTLWPWATFMFGCTGTWGNVWRRIQNKF